MSLHSYRHTKQREAGCDEAGRGCLAGPVYAASVILPPDFTHSKLDDSKKLTPEERLKLREVIKQEAISWAIAAVDNKEIDEINILNASIEAMHRAVEQLIPQPQYLLIDGHQFTPHPSIPHECIIKGDSKYYSIAAASILAKTYRDEYMEELHNEYPVYEWESNKGYPTPPHRKAINAHGITPYHRRSFNLDFQQVLFSDKSDKSKQDDV